MSKPQQSGIGISLRASERGGGVTLILAAGGEEAGMGAVSLSGWLKFVMRTNVGFWPTRADLVTS
jgi:hypothetical protein